MDKTKKSFVFKSQAVKDCMFDKIVEETSFLKEDVSFSARVYCIIYDISENPKCECGKLLEFNQYSIGFRLFCSSKCSANSSIKKEKIVKTNLEKYGCKNAFQTKVAKDNLNAFHADKERVAVSIEKGNQTLKNKLGVASLDDVRRWKYSMSAIAKKDKYGSAGYNNRKKANLSRDEHAIRQKMMETSLKKYGVPHPMQHPDIFDKRIRNSFYYKDYVFPSGKIVQIQGFEDLALDELLLKYNEDEIAVGSKNMPTIWYVFEFVKRRYFPDIFIPKDNLLIEVKSDFTMRANFEINNIKAQAARDHGYNFEFYVYDQYKRRIKM